MRGGFRQNAGRKQGFSAKKAEEARRLLSEQLAEEIEPITKVLISQAKKGNMRAIKELFDRAWGRPQQEEWSHMSEGLKISFDKSFNKPEPITGMNIIVRKD